MSPSQRKKLNRAAACYEDLPQHVREDLLGIFRRQDREYYEELRRCLQQRRKERKQAR